SSCRTVNLVTVGHPLVGSVAVADLADLGGLHQVNDAFLSVCQGLVQGLGHGDHLLARIRASLARHLHHTCLSDSSQVEWWWCGKCHSPHFRLDSIQRVKVM